MKDETKDLIEADATTEEIAEPEEVIELPKGAISKLVKKQASLTEKGATTKQINMWRQAEAIALGIDELTLVALMSEVKPKPEGLALKKAVMLAYIDEHVANFCDAVNSHFAADDEEGQIFWAMLAMNELAEMRGCVPPEGGSNGYIMMIANAKLDNAGDWQKGIYDGMNYGWEDGRSQYTHRRIPVAKSAGVFKARG